MKRRSFISTSAGTSMLLTRSGGFAQKEGRESTGGTSQGTIGQIGRYTIEQIRNQYEYDLFEDFVPFHNKYVIDRQYGCYYANTHHDGSHAHTNTTASFMGSGIWCYSFLYNNLAKEDRYLDVATMGVKFIMKHRPTGDNLWPGNYTREGEVIGNSRGSWSSDCYIAEGLAEYSRATGDAKYWDIAMETINKCLILYDKPDFEPESRYPGARNLWYWMLLMWFGTCALFKKDDADLKKMVDRCMDAIMNYHLNPKFNLMNLYINHDLTRSEDPKYSEVAAFGHATESTWMIMYEAVRRKDKALFDRSYEMFKRHAIVSKDYVYGGYYDNCTNVDQNNWELAKVFYAQAFILMNSLYHIEHMADQWSKNIFSDQYAWVQEKLPLKKYGYALWLKPRDRFVTFFPEETQKSVYHHPQHIMLNLASARRMMDRGGKVSGVFST